MTWMPQVVISRIWGFYKKINYRWLGTSRKMAEEMCMTVMAGSDAVDDERLSIADIDDAANDGDNQTRN